MARCHRRIVTAHTTRVAPPAGEAGGYDPRLGQGGRGEMLTTHTPAQQIAPKPDRQPTPY